jgi:hypothetical protein
MFRNNSVLDMMSDRGGRCWAQTFLGYSPFLRKGSWLMRDHRAVCVCSDAHVCVLCLSLSSHFNFWTSWLISQYLVRTLCYLSQSQPHILQFSTTGNNMADIKTYMEATLAPLDVGSWNDAWEKGEIILLHNVKLQSGSHMKFIFSFQFDGSN